MEQEGDLDMEEETEEIENGEADSPEDVDSPRASLQPVSSDMISKKIIIEFRRKRGSLKQGNEKEVRQTIVQLTSRVWMLPR